MLLQVASAPSWPEMQADARNLSKALHLGTVFSRPALGKLLLDGSLNAFRDLISYPRANLPKDGLYARYVLAARQATDLTPAVAPAAQAWDARLAKLSYESVKASHIHVLWPRALQEKNDVTKAGLWHVCPAHVYEARTSPTAQ